MSTSYGSTPQGITGTHYGGPGLGVLGSLIPYDGVDGPGYLYPALNLPADNSKEIRGVITRWPIGVLVVQEDSAFTYIGSTDYALFKLYVDGIASTEDIGYGVGISRLDLAVGDTGTISGNIDIADILASGIFEDAGASTLSGTIDIADILASGIFGDAGDTGTISGNIDIADILASGIFGDAGASTLSGTIDIAAILASGILGDAGDTGTISGNIDIADILASGIFGDAGASTLSGTIDIAAILASGILGDAGASTLSGTIDIADILASGILGDVPVSPSSIGIFVTEEVRQTFIVVKPPGIVVTIS